MSEWIKTTDRLPEEYVPVIVARIYERGKLLRVEQGQRQQGGWWHVYGTNIKEKNVIYWMPLPEPPEVFE